VTTSGEIYFTDPIYGWEYGTCPQPYLPNQVFRFNPLIGNVRAVADGFDRSNDIGLSKDGSVVYVIYTGTQVGDGTIDFQAPRTIYAFYVQHPNGTKSSAGVLLGNRRLFAFPDIGGAKVSRQTHCAMFILGPMMVSWCGIKDLTFWERSSLTVVLRISDLGNRACCLRWVVLGCGELIFQSRSLVRHI